MEKGGYALGLRLTQRISGVDGGQDLQWIEEGGAAHSNTQRIEKRIDG